MKIERDARFCVSFFAEVVFGLVVRVAKCVSLLRDRLLEGCILKISINFAKNIIMYGISQT